MGAVFRLPVVVLVPAPFSKASIAGHAGGPVTHHFHHCLRLSASSRRPRPLCHVGVAIGEHRGLKCSPERPRFALKAGRGRNSKACGLRNDSRPSDRAS
ncbi:hypothetical protein LX32DRAFT_131387 [Colletotrichum zoysiae]|uniref:Uncharacterized protein n=1 Tax=Colletotrichum zoysiae TaxID=1216348 RepID=A0AAD9LVL4_9PEZI|nr:hypothetical protein LX32DRAFT_131387 [Colletotrichum zoysiae]